MSKNKNEISSLKPFFEPKSVAIIGASRTPGKLGYNILSNLIDLGFKGELYPVNPKATEILGLKAYPHVDLIPEDLDVAVIATPASTAPEIMESCASARARRFPTYLGKPSRPSRGFRLLGMKG